MTTEYLLYPEWQGYGLSSAVYDGAAAMALALFPGTKFTLVDCPPAEELSVRDGVLALDSIAPRFRQTLDRLRASSPDVVVTVGGTCGVEAAPIAYLNERYDGNLAVVWFDAHGDLNTAATSPSGHFHGMVLRTLLGDGPIDYVGAMRRQLRTEQIVLAGTRDLDPAESEYISQHGIAVVAPVELADPERIVDAVRSHRFEHIYVHVDLDCFRPDDIPDTLMQTAGGPPFEHVAAAHGALRRSFRVRGMSVVEYAYRGGRSLERLGKIFPDETPG